MKETVAFPAGAFGHPGAGGSHAFADPARGLGFAYVMNQMERSVFPTEKALRLVRAVEAALSAP
jgi:CubicO group peptidase (beta-lactamase class C family)